MTVPICIGFVSLLSYMTILASAGSGVGHVHLFSASNEWLEICKNYLVQKNVVEKLEGNVAAGRHMDMVESTCHLLNYVSTIESPLVLEKVDDV